MITSLHQNKLIITYIEVLCQSKKLVLITLTKRVPIIKTTTATTTTIIIITQQNNNDNLVIVVVVVVVVVV